MVIGQSWVRSQKRKITFFIRLHFSNLIVLFFHYKRELRKQWKWKEIHILDWRSVDFKKVVILFFALDLYGNERWAVPSHCIVSLILNHSKFLINFCCVPDDGECRSGSGSVCKWRQGCTKVMKIVLYFKSQISCSKCKVFKTILSRKLESAEPYRKKPKIVAESFFWKWKLKLKIS